MQIRDLHTVHRHIPLHTPFKTALRTATEIESIEVTIELENGVTGKGAAAPTWVITGDSTESIQAALLGPIKDALVGKIFTISSPCLMLSKRVALGIQVPRQRQISRFMMLTVNYLKCRYINC